MYKSIEALTADVILELGLASGAAVQVYTEPQIENNIRKAFDHLFTKRFWQHLTFSTVHNLDEEGYPTSNLVGIKSHLDLEWVRVFPFAYHDDLLLVDEDPDDENIRQRGYTLIPFGHTLQQERLLRVVPKDMYEKVKVRARRYPEIVDKTSIVPFDAVAITHFVTANILANDGMNPPAQQRHDMLFTQRYQDLVSAEAKGAVSYTGTPATTFTVAED